VSKYPLREVIQNPEAKGRIAKWALELMGQNILYTPRSAVKSQVLANFVTEWMEIQTPPALIKHETWIMYFDGSVMKEGAGVGLVFISPLGVRMEYMVRLHFTASNNIAKYEALINDLQIAVELEIRCLEIRGDSELVVDQVMKDKNYMDPNMRLTAKLYVTWKASSTYSSFITCCVTKTKPPTTCQDPHQVASRYRTGSSRVTNTRPLCKQRGRSRQRLRSLKSWQLTNHPS
jgi:ribonuclease HI